MSFPTPINWLVAGVETEKLRSKVRSLTLENLQLKARMADASQSANQIESAVEDLQAAAQTQIGYYQAAIEGIVQMLENISELGGPVSPAMLRNISDTIRDNIRRPD